MEVGVWHPVVETWHVYCVVILLSGLSRPQSRPRRMWRGSLQCWTNTWTPVPSLWERGSVLLTSLWPAPCSGSTNRFDTQQITVTQSIWNTISIDSDISSIDIWYLSPVGPWAFFPAVLPQRNSLVHHLCQPAPVQGCPWRGQAVWKDGPIRWWVTLSS